MTAERKHWQSGRRCGDLRSQTSARAAPIVVAHLLFENVSQVLFAQRDQKVQGLAPWGPCKPLAERIGLLRPRQGVQDVSSHRCQGTFQSISSSSGPLQEVVCVRICRKSSPDTRAPLPIVAESNPLAVPQRQCVLLIRCLPWRGQPRCLSLNLPGLDRRIPFAVLRGRCHCPPWR